MKFKYFNQESHLSDEGIALFVDALKLDKTAQLPEEIKAHIETCEVCHSQGIELYSLLGEVDYQNQGTHPILVTRERKGVYRRLIFRIAAAAVLAALAFFYYHQQSNRDTISNDNLVLEDSIESMEKVPFVGIPKDETKIEDEQKFKAPEEKEPKPVQKDLIPKTVEKDNRQLFAMNYTPNEDFEAFVEEVYRSSSFGFAGQDDKTDFKEGEEITFSWEDEENSEWTIIVFNNRGAEIHRKEISEPNYILKDLIPPGLYYWRLETTDDLLHTGKFIVE